MTSTIQALQALYIALGGALTDTYDDINDGSTVGNLVRIPDMINALADLITDGALNQLPTVTADNNGQVLTVVSGEWANADLPD